MWLDTFGNAKHNKYDLPLVMCVRGIGNVERTQTVEASSEYLSTTWHQKGRWEFG